MEVNNGEDFIFEEDEMTDEDMAKILKVLHDIPQVPVPEEFHVRFSKSLEEEGVRIRKRNNGGFFQRSRWYVKAAAAAACFIVVFVSVSVYNDNKDDRFESQSLSDCAVDERAGGESQMGAESIEPYGYEGSNSISKFKEDLLMDANASFRDMDEARGADTPCVEEDGEAQNYLALIDKRLFDYEYELIACELDDETGDYRIMVHVTYDPHGKDTDRQLIFTGRLGEIYEEQSKEPQINSD